jgi:hypothetical protein
MTYPQINDSTESRSKDTIDCIEVFDGRKILGSVQEVVELPDRSF